MTTDPAGRVALLRVEVWERDLDAATPNCPACGRSLGIRRAVFSPTVRDEWECDKHGLLISALAPAEGEKTSTETNGDTP